MGVVVVQVGQGGNQYGYSLFNTMASLVQSPLHCPNFFRENATSPPSARAVLVDMEAKVIANVTRKSEGAKWRYTSSSCYTKDTGSGNNWARGFCKHGPECQEPILDLVRREVEACDLFGGFISLQSMAGGTGSGLGAYLLEVLHDEYPSACALSHCIWPFESGEVAVQGYNAILTLAHIHDMADGVIITQNELLSMACRKYLGIQRPSFDDFNEVGAQAFASVLLPAYWRPIDPCTGSEESVKSGVSDPVQSFQTVPRVHMLSDLISSLCTHPRYRMLLLRSTAQIPPHLLNFTTFSWASQLKQLRRMLNAGPLQECENEYLNAHSLALASTSNAKSNDFNGIQSEKLYGSVDRSVASLLVLRGKGSQYADVSLFADEKLYPVWSVDPLSVAAHHASFGKCEMAAGLLSNCQSAIAPAARSLSQAYSMFAAKAYLFQYHQHGLESETFDAAFASVEDILARYSAL